MKSEAYDRSRGFAAVVGASGGAPLRLAISIDKELAGNQTAQLIALALCSILPRVSERYTRIDLCVGKKNICLPRVKFRGLLADYLLAELRTICPWGKFRAVEQLVDNYDQCIVIGRQTPISAMRVVYAIASGWRCFVSEQAPSLRLPRSFNPFSSLATAALAVMFVYRRAENIGSILAEPEINGWSLLNYSTSSDDGPALPFEVNVEDVRQAGLGGTGNALLWALRFGPELMGNWLAFEHENADITNWNRYLLLMLADAEAGRAKGEIAASQFEGWQKNLKFVALSSRVEPFLPMFTQAKTVLATVDDPQVRVKLQPCSGQLLLNVGTSSHNLSVSVHQHEKILNGDACLACLYGQDGQAERRQRESTVSFVLAMLGAVLGAEFIKSYAYPEHMMRNSWLADIFYPASARVQLRTATQGCSVCEGLLGVATTSRAPSPKMPLARQALSPQPPTSPSGDSREDGLRETKQQI